MSFSPMQPSRGGEGVEMGLGKAQKPVLGLGNDKKKVCPNFQGIFRNSLSSLTECLHLSILPNIAHL